MHMQIIKNINYTNITDRLSNYGYPISNSVTSNLTQMHSGTSFVTSQWAHCYVES